MIAVDADVHAESAGIRMHVTGNGQVLTCLLDGDPAGIFTTLRHSGEMLSAMRFMAPILQRAGLRFDIVIGARRVGQIGRGVKQNALARMLRLPAAHIGT